MKMDYEVEDIDKPQLMLFVQVRVFTCACVHVPYTLRHTHTHNTDNTHTHTHTHTHMYMYILSPTHVFSPSNRCKSRQREVSLSGVILKKSNYSISLQLNKEQTKVHTHRHLEP